MEFLKCRDVRLKGPGKRNKPDVVATTAKHPDSGSQISRYGWINLVPRVHVPFGQHQDKELWNNQQARSQSLRGFCF